MPVTVFSARPRLVSLRFSTVLMLGAFVAALASAPVMASEDPGVAGTEHGRVLSTQAQKAGTIYLTFDDGPDQLFTPLLLDLLDEYGARVTFFPLGRNMKSRWGGDEVQDLLNRGHAVGNHTMHHRRLTLEHPWKVAADLEEASALLADLSGFRPSCYRAPYGDRNPVVDAVGNALGMVHIPWTADPQEWRNPLVPAVLDYLTSERHDGAIVLLHDRKWLSLHIVTELIPGFLSDGWRFEVVPPCQPEGHREARMATRTEGATPVGAVDSMSISEQGLTVEGWAFDADAPAGGLVIRASLDGSTATRVGATGGAHRFSILLPGVQTIRPVCFWVADVGRRHDSNLGCHLPERG